LALFELWSTGQSEEASTLMRQHIAMTLEDLRNQFEAEKTAASA
jgi:DNA-binding GntR family transcriptional regulator